ncbi:MAG: hypothetical protein K2X87_30750 [Gemmataceae bacterium]|nr:hypothetical protein [Gemmataceae bacterium]
MAGCVLRVGGRDFAVDTCLAGSPFEPSAVWRRGEARPGRPPNDGSGFSLVVSEAGGADFFGQVRDAITFLTSHQTELARLRDAAGLDGVVLDFGLDRVGTFTQSVTFPAALVRLAGGLGMALAVSIYPVS